MITPSHNNGPGWAESFKGFGTCTICGNYAWKVDAQDEKLEHCQFCAVKAERDMWKANHDNQVNLRRMLMDRPDLKERAELIQKLMAENERLGAAILQLKKIHTASMIAYFDTEHDKYDVEMARRDLAAMKCETTAEQWAEFDRIVHVALHSQ